MSLNGLSSNAIIVLCLVKLLIKNVKTLFKTKNSLDISGYFSSTDFNRSAPIYANIQLKSKALHYLFHSIK